MGQKLRTDVPQIKEGLTPDWPYLQKFRKDDEYFKKCQKADYDNRHKTHPVPELPAGTGV